MPHIAQIKTKDLTWVNITKPGKAETEYLRKNFNFHPLDLQDCLPPLQRPKLTERPDYLFMILLFPVYNRKTREINPSEIDFFISQDRLVTVGDNKLSPLVELFELCQNDQSAREKYFTGNPAVLLYEILNCLLLYCFPMLNHISLDTDNIEKQIFAGREKKMVSEVLIVKRNIVNFRKTMQAHANVMKRLIEKTPQFFSTARLNIYFDSLVEHSGDIWDSLENYRQTINALQETNESLISFRLNDIMKILTIISVTMLPVTLVASVFGMNAINMPIVYNPFGFWIILGIMGFISMTMIWYFRKRRWL